MAFDFPNTPTIGERWPNPAIAGQPQYQWNGTEWTAAVFDPAGYVKRTGDTMTGALSLSGDPTQALHAVPKQYLDAQRQRISLAGGKSFDVQVPVGATLARLTGVIMPTSAANILPVVQLSIAPGVFRTIGADYVTDGFYHQTNNVPTDVINVPSSAGFAGMALSLTNVNAGLSILFDGKIILARPSNAIRFSGDFRAIVWNGSGGIHSFLHTYDNFGSTATNILALRLMSSAGDNWAAGSHFNVEWL